jgi:signal transduction histidine kinase
MRRRLARSMTTVVIVSVLLVSIPTFLFGAVFIWALGANITHVTANSLATAGARAVHDEAGGMSTYDASVLGSAIPPDMYVVITDPPSTSSAYSADGVDAKVHPYGKQTTGLAWHASAQKEGGPKVDVTLDGTWAEKGVAVLFLILLIMGLVAIFIARLVARRLATRVTKPLDELVQTVEQIGQGDPSVTKRRYGVPELDRVAEVLERGVHYTYDLLERERRLSAEVGHQLRTPLTAIALRLDEIVTNANDSALVEEEGRIAQDQVMRLAGVVDEVIASVRDQPPSINRVDIDEVCESLLREWRNVFNGKRRHLLVRGETGQVAAGSRSSVSAVLSTLIENSLAHGAGTTTVTIRRQSSWVVIEVGDEGTGVPDGLDVFAPGVSGAGSSGLGLATARTLIDAIGGRLELVSSRPTIFGAFLPGLDVPESEVITPAPAVQL